MVKQNDKFYWDLKGVYTPLPSTMEAIKLLTSNGIISFEEAKKLDRKQLVEKIKNDLNNGGRYMEVPASITTGKLF